MWNRRTARVLALVAVVALVGWTAASAATAGEKAAKRVSKTVEKLAKTGNGHDKVDVILTFDRTVSASAETDVKGQGGAVNRKYKKLPMMAIRVPRRALEAVSKSRGVRFVAQDSEVSAMSESARQTANIPPIGSTYDAVYNGGGYAVAVIDSGVGAHPDLTILHQQDFTAPKADNNPYDPYGHGTHVAGIISGYGTASGYVHWGQAWNAPIVSLRVLNRNGSGATSDLIAALDWILVNHARYGIRVANLSVGKAIEEAAADDPLVQAVEAVVDAGIVVVCSAGNFGKEGMGSITSPGNSSKVITVGSWTDKGTASQDDDFLSTYSSTGPTFLDHFLKPDLVAPGNRLVSAMSNEAALKTDLPERVMDCGTFVCQAPFFELSGTSMAAPMVSGAAIRMIGKEPTLNPASVKARLMASTQPVPGAPTEVGAGLLDVTAALDATGYTDSAPSPKMELSSDGTKVYIDDTATTWGVQFPAAVLWDDMVSDDAEKVIDGNVGALSANDDAGSSPVADPASNR